MAIVIPAISLYGSYPSAPLEEYDSADNTKEQGVKFEIYQAVSINNIKPVDILPII